MHSNNNNDHCVARRPLTTSPTDTRHLALPPSHQPTMQHDWDCPTIPTSRPHRTKRHPSRPAAWATTNTTDATTHDGATSPKDNERALPACPPAKPAPRHVTSQHPPWPLPRSAPPHQPTKRPHHHVTRRRQHPPCHDHNHFPTCRPHDEARNACCLAQPPPQRPTSVLTAHGQRHTGYPPP